MLKYSLKKPDPCNKELGIHTIRQLKSTLGYVKYDLMSKIDSKKFVEFYEDKHRVNVMEEEFDEIKKNHTWEIVP